MCLINDSVIVNVPAILWYRLSIPVHRIVRVLFQNCFEIGLDFYARANQEFVCSIGVRWKIFISWLDKFKKSLQVILD